MNVSFLQNIYLGNKMKSAKDECPKKDMCCLEPYGVMLCGCEFVASNLRFLVFWSFLALLGALRVLEASWRHLWAILERLGGVLERLGGILERLGGVLERLGGILERLGAVLEASWRRLGASWSVLEAS